MDELLRYGDRSEGASLAVKAALAHAEENFLAESDYSVGTWFARVQETLAVAAVRVETHVGTDPEGVVETGPVFEHLGLFADICAEAIRATARLRDEPPPDRAREEIRKGLAMELGVPAGPPPRWAELGQVLLGCSGALEPVANGLREGDLAFEELDDVDGVVQGAFLEVAERSYRAVYDLCA